MPLSFAYWRFTFFSYFGRKKFGVAVASHDASVYTMPLSPRGLTASYCVRVTALSPSLLIAAGQLMEFAGNPSLSPVSSPDVLCRHTVVHCCFSRSLCNCPSSLSQYACDNVGAIEASWFMILWGSDSKGRKRQLYWGMMSLFGFNSTFTVIFSLKFLNFRLLVWYSL